MRFRVSPDIDNHQAHPILVDHTVNNISGGRNAGYQLNLNYFWHWPVD
jgi:hypothetical protein